MGNRRRNSGRNRGSPKPAEQKSKSQTGASESGCSNTISPTEAIYEQRHASASGQSAQAPEKESKYDRAIARWTFVVGFFTGLLVLATGISAYFLHTTDEAIRTQGRIMQSQLDEAKADRRPFVGISDEEIVITKPLTFNETGATFGFDTTLRNVGKSVATNVMTINGKLQIGPLAPRGVLVNTAKMNSTLKERIGCDEFSARTFGAMGAMILPGGNGSRTIGPLQAPHKEFGSSQDGDMRAWLTYCIFYKDDSGRSHGTGFILMFVPESATAEFPPATGVVSGKLVMYAFGASAF